MGARARGRRASASSGSRRASDPTATPRPPVRRATPSARPRAGTEVGALEACNRHSRASAQASATSASVYQPPPQKSVGARPSSRMRVPSARTRSPVPPFDGRAWSGAVQCVWCPSGPREAASRARSSHSASSSPNAGSAGRMSAAIGNPPGRRRCSATKRAHTASSSGRSTWQDTTAYRSRAVAPIVVEAISKRSTGHSSSWPQPRCRASLVLSRERDDDPRGVRRQERPIRDDARRSRDVRLHRRVSRPRTPSRSTAGSSPASTPVRPLLARGRDRTDRRRRRHGVVVFAIGSRAALGRRRTRGRTDRNAPPVRRLARHPPEPRGARRARLAAARALRARGVRAPLASRSRR